MRNEEDGVGEMMADGSRDILTWGAVTNAGAGQSGNDAYGCIGKRLRKEFGLP